MTSLRTLAVDNPGLPCRTTDPELWHSNNPARRRRAAHLCQGCPLLAACRNYAFETREVWGVWGGLDFTAVETHCGSERGHQIHRRNGEFPCTPCVDAHALLVERRRRARLAAEHAKGGTTRGYEIHRRLGEEACARCRTALARRSAEQRARAQGAAEAPVSVLRGRAPADPVPGAPAGTQALPLAV